MIGKPRIKLPDTAKAGETIEVKALVRHPMERGHRKDAQGRPVARDIIHTFIAELDNKRVFHADFRTGVASNPFLSFYVTVTAPGRLVLTWIGDNDFEIKAERTLNIAS